MKLEEQDLLEEQEELRDGLGSEFDELRNGVLALQNAEQAAMARSTMKL